MDYAASSLRSWVIARRRGAATGRITGALARHYRRVITALAVTAGALLAAIFLAVFYAAWQRSTGRLPSTSIGGACEYALLYVTLLGAPWVLRQKGHLSIPTYVTRLPETLRRLIERLVYLIGFGACLAIAYTAFDLAVSGGGVEIRVFAMPRWLLFLPMAVSFLCLAVEFGRLLRGVDSLWAKDPYSGGGL